MITYLINQDDAYLFSSYFLFVMIILKPNLLTMILSNLFKEAAIKYGKTYKYFEI